MFRPFVAEDLHKMEKNAFYSERYNILELNDNWCKITYEETGTPKAILAWNETDKIAIPMFLIASVYFGRGAARNIKRFVLQEILRLETCAEKAVPFVYTVSKNNERLNRWHKFLGMNEERNIFIDDDKYLVWAFNRGS